MEQWEQDYIDAVTKSRQAREQGRTADYSYEEGYDSSRWTEITLPDGQKSYIPKEGAFDVKQKSGKKKHRRSGNRKTGKVFQKAGIILISVMFFTLKFQQGTAGNFSDSQKAELGARHVSLQGLISGQILGGTYRNGYGFADMMHFFDQMQTERCDFLNEIALNIHDLSAIDIEKWKQTFESREELLEELKYDDSYAAYVEAERDVFRQQKELLSSIESREKITTIAAMHDELTMVDDNLRRILIVALDKNGIEYSLNDDELRYWYKQY